MQDDKRDLDVERQLDTWAGTHSGEGISPELARKLRGALTPSLTPVKPMPSQGWLVLTFLTVFVAGSAGLTMLMSKDGLHLMTSLQTVGIAAILASGGILFAVKLVAQMIPGSRSSIPMSGQLALGGIAVFGGLAMLFPWGTSGNFISEGWPCAGMELALVIPATAGFWLLARKGALFASTRLGATLTGLAAFLVLMPLQFQCMSQQAPHLLVWHGGTALLMIGLGALGGTLWRGSPIS